MRRNSKNSTGNSGPRTPRQLRVGEEIRHALAAAFQHGDYPWPDGVPRTNITVTEVRIGPDLRHATAYVMPLGGQHIKETVDALRTVAPFFRHVIAENVEMRWVPELHFSADTSFEYASKIEKILHDPAVARDLKGKE
jgi:ribosome-binding factor A